MSEGEAPPTGTATGALPAGAQLEREAARRTRLERLRHRRRRRRLGAAAVLSASALICVGLIAAGQIRAGIDYDTAIKANRGFTVAPLVTPTTGVTTDLVSVVGDEWASPKNAVDNRPWPLLMQRATGVSVRAFASNGGAYVSSAVGAGGATFASGAQSIPPTSSVVVIFGGARDATDSGVDLAAAATHTIALAAQRAPKATIVLVGPVPERPGETGQLAAVRATLKTVATTSRATWIDPIAEKWLDSPRYWDSSAAAPSAAGNARLAVRMQAALATYLQATGSTPDGSSG